MKHILLAVLVSATLCFADDKLPEAPKPSDKTVTLNVSGMDCSHCAKTVASVYAQLEGVADASADADKGTVTIKYDSKTVNEAALLEALSEKPKYIVTKPAPTK